MSHGEPDGTEPCTCANGHGPMTPEYRPDMNGLLTPHWTWVCPVCQEERMWPDNWPEREPV